MGNDIDGLYDNHNADDPDVIRVFPDKMQPSEIDMGEIIDPETIEKPYCPPICPTMEEIEEVENEVTELNAFKVDEENKLF